MALVDSLGLCPAALFLSRQRVELALDAAELLDQRLLDRRGAGAFLLGGDDLGSSDCLSSSPAAF